jgi:hypothetical protein
MIQQSVEPAFKCKGVYPQEFGRIVLQRVGLLLKVQIHLGTSYRHREILRSNGEQ